MKHCCKCNKSVFAGGITKDNKIICKECREKQDCNHDKIYQDVALCSKPPMYPWMCCKCGREGIDFEKESPEVPDAQKESKI